MAFKQKCAYIKCRGPTTSKQTMKIAEKEALIRQKMTKLSNGDITRFDFVKRISFKPLPT